MVQWHPGWKLLALDRASFSVWAADRVAYPIGEIVRPASWMHGPLCVFSNFEDAVKFWENTKYIVGSGTVIVPCAYAPSQFKIAWVPRQYGGHGDVTYNYCDKLPEGTILADAVVCLA